MNYHAEKGIVQDILLFYDARKIREAVSLTADLEKLWQNTTYDQNEGKSYGIIWSESKRLHLSFKSHETPLIPQDQCVLRRDNKDDKKTINRLIRHLSSYDTYISYHTTSKTRMLGKSVIHNRKKDRRSEKEGAYIPGGIPRSLLVAGLLQSMEKAQGACYASDTGTPSHPRSSFA